MAIFCSNCGTQLADGSTVCTACGKPLTPAATPAGGPPTSSAPASGAGLTDNAAGAIAYITIIPPIIFLLTEPYKSSRFVRFHSFQCLFLAAFSVVCRLLFWFAPAGVGLLLLPIRLVFSLVIFVAWLVCLIKASQGQMFKLPIIGDMAESQANTGASH